jgi:hypothetical protein
VTRLLGAVGGYNPSVYEPKDAARQAWLDERWALFGYVPVEVAINTLLFLLVALVWLALVPPGASRRR